MRIWQDVNQNRFLMDAFSIALEIFSIHTSLKGFGFFQPRPYFPHVFVSKTLLETTQQATNWSSIHQTGTYEYYTEIKPAIQ